MKIAIYPIGKAIPMTTVECDNWELKTDGHGKRLILSTKKDGVVAQFFAEHIAGFQEII